MRIYGLILFFFNNKQFYLKKYELGGSTAPKAPLEAAPVFLVYRLMHMYFNSGSIDAHLAHFSQMSILE